jgi:hypothetical protein
VVDISTLSGKAYEQRERCLTRALRSIAWAATFTLNRLRAPVDADMDALAGLDAERVAANDRAMRESPP